MRIFGGRGHPVPYHTQKDGTDRCADDTDKGGVGHTRPLRPCAFRRLFQRETTHTDIRHRGFPYRHQHQLRNHRESFPLEPEDADERRTVSDRQLLHHTLHHPPRQQG